MEDMLGLIQLVAGLSLPFIAMPLLWRRMKRVRDDAYHKRKRLWHEQPWEEKIASEDDLNLARASAINGDLIDLGSRGREARWPIDNA